jgi:uncharacterized protein YuzE
MDMVAPEIVGFEISISARDDGTLEAIYIRIAGGDVHKTVEIDGETELMADYDIKGQLIGIEILSPVRLSKIASLVDEARREPFRKTVERYAPSEMVLA